ncbi:MAG: hypothetical protein ABW178_00210 [Pseudoxanthomonas sp.]
MTTLRNTKALPPTTLYTKPREDKRIAQQALRHQLDAFERAGGLIEKLGITPLRRSS